MKVAHEFGRSHSFLHVFWRVRRAKQLVLLFNRLGGCGHGCRIRPPGCHLIIFSRVVLVSSQVPGLEIHYRQAFSRRSAVRLASPLRFRNSAHRAICQRNSDAQCVRLVSRNSLLSFHRGGVNPHHWLLLLVHHGDCRIIGAQTITNSCARDAAWVSFPSGLFQSAQPCAATPNGSPGLSLDS